MVSTFDELLATVKEYPFDVVAMSETWLKSNPHLLNYVSIPGYANLFRNRDDIRGGGVGVYIRKSINFKRRIDIERIEPELEHLWVEISGRNKHSNLLLGVMYRSNRIQDFQTWMGKAENLFSQLSINWDGLLMITGDFNIDLLKSEQSQVKQYTDMLESFNLHQHVQLPTRVTRTSKTLIDHIITNIPSCVTYTNVLPCPTVSDHDAPYACVNIRVTRFQPRYKNIRDERHFDEKAFIKDFSTLPLNLVYSTEEPDDKLHLFNELIKSCLDRHAPLRKTKITRPPAPWLKTEDMRQLKNERDKLRHLAHKTKLDCVWQAFRDIRNQIRTKIKKVKRSFYQKALSSRKPKELWRTIHRILHPNPQPINADPNTLNKHFSSTSQRLLGTTPLSSENLQELINSLPNCLSEPFHLRQVSHNEVLKQLTSMRSDCSTGVDQIPVKYVKLVAEFCASPLTHILNEFISSNSFPLAWKLARVSPIPKTESPTEADHFRPISVLSALSKIYERLVLAQMLEYIEQHQVFKSSISGYRKGHSTTTVLLRIRDDIIKAMKKGEITLIAFADFSKAFDTVDYATVLKRLHSIGFSRDALNWFLSYLTNRKQFVQVNDKKSELLDVHYGVPQGSILGPILFNIYVNDLQSDFHCSCFQYADDTTLYDHCTPRSLAKCANKLNGTMSTLEDWASKSNLLLNETKTKQMLITTQQMSRAHELENFVPFITVKGKVVERVTTFKLLGTLINENLKWTDHIKQVTSSCYAVLSTLRKLKNLAPIHVKKQLAESLVLSKLAYNNVVYHPLPAYLQRKLQRIQNAAASFVLNRYTNECDVLQQLHWLPIKEKAEQDHLRLAHKVLWDPLSPEYLKLDIRKVNRELRSSCATNLVIPPETGSFQDNCSKLFNDLPAPTRNNKDLNSFTNQTKKILINKAKKRLLIVNN
jgi:exonuclease III